MMRVIEPFTATAIAWAFVAQTGGAVGLDSLIEKAGATTILAVVVWLLMKGVIATLEKVKDILEKVMAELAKLGAAVDRLTQTVEDQQCKFKEKS